MIKEIVDFGLVIVCGKLSSLQVRPLILEDMLRALDFLGYWEGFFPLVEFAYNNSYQAAIEIAPYEAFYGRKCRSPVH